VRERIDSLDIFRGYMAFAVAVYHFSNWYRPFQEGCFPAYTIKKIGAYGVEGFFIISGFCFFYLYGAEVCRGRGLRNFFTKRFFRIAPLYYLAVAANLILGLRAGPEHSVRMVLENASLAFGLIHPNHSLVLGGWSIGLEYVFYLGFPFLAWGASRSRAFLPVTALALLALSLPFSFVYVPGIADPDPKFHMYVQVANHAFLFLLGGLIAHARLGSGFRLRTGPFLILAVLLTLAFTLKYRNFYDDWVIMAGWARYWFLAICFAGVALFAFYDFPDSPLKTAGKFMGDVSYSVYLLHPLVYEGVRRWTPGSLGAWPHFLLGLGLTIGLSALTYRFLEKPMMGVGRRLCRP